MRQDRVQEWLQHVHSETVGTTPSKKRPLTPPMSTTSTPSKKRRKRGYDTEDDTPRPATRAQSTLSASETSSAASAGRSSPRKQLFNLRLVDDGIDVRDLNLDGDEPLPERLLSLLYGLDPAIERHKILPLYLRQQAQEFFKGKQAARQWDKDQLYDTSREALGPTLPLEFVHQLVSDARKCGNMLLDEAGWSQLVYCPLLNAITRDISLFELLPCSTASILPLYRPGATTSRMIDLAIAVNPCETDNATIRALIKEDYGQSINQTGFPALCERPIAVSIEVKRTSDGADKARLQLAVWLAAQWKKLQNLSDQLPDYLLAFWIQGHDWSLVVSTRENQRTVIWTKLELGSTSSCIGVYQIEWAVRYVLADIRDNYWPWFRQNCLERSNITSLIELDEA